MSQHTVAEYSSLRLFIGIEIVKEVKRIFADLFSYVFLIVLVWKYQRGRSSPPWNVFHYPVHVKCIKAKIDLVITNECCFCRNNEISAIKAKVSLIARGFCVEISGNES